MKAKCQGFGKCTSFSYAVYTRPGSIRTCICASSPQCSAGSIPVSSPAPLGKAGGDPAPGDFAGDLAVGDPAPGDLEGDFAGDSAGDFLSSAIMKGRGDGFQEEMNKEISIGGNLGFPSSNSGCTDEERGETVQGSRRRSSYLEKAPSDSGPTYHIFCEPRLTGLRLDRTLALKPNKTSTLALTLSGPLAHLRW